MGGVTLGGNRSWACARGGCAFLLPRCRLAFGWSELDRRARLPRWDGGSTPSPSPPSPKLKPSAAASEAPSWLLPRLPAARAARPPCIACTAADLARARASCGRII